MSGKTTVHFGHPAAHSEFLHAQQLRERGDFTAAADCLKRAIACDPTEPAYHLELAVVFLSHQKHVAAVQEFKRARALGPDDPNCALGAGLAYAELGDPRRAIAELETARPAFPQSVRLLTSLGRCYRLQSERQKALECLQTALKVNPQATAARAEIDLVRRVVTDKVVPADPNDEVRKSTADRHRDTAVPAPPRPTRVQRRAEHRRRAEEALQAGRYADAFEARRQTLLEGERDDRMVFSLYECGTRAGLGDARREILAELVRRTPRWAAAHAVLGMTLHDQGQFAEAEQHYLRARKLKFDAEYLFISICGLFLDTKRPEMAVRIARQGLKNWPDSVDLHYRLGLACFRLGWKKESVQAFQRVVALDPNHGDALYCLAELFMDFGPPASHTVEKYLLRVLEVNPRDVRAHVNLTIIYGNRGDAQAARRQAEQAKSLGLNDPRLTELRKQLRLSP